jgi:hypothetical protein
LPNDRAITANDKTTVSRPRPAPTAINPFEDQRYRDSGGRGKLFEHKLEWRHLQVDLVRMVL